MPYTAHGHHIAGTDVDESLPETIRPCGGPGICLPCSTQAMNHRFMFGLETAADRLDKLKEYFTL